MTRTVKPIRPAFWRLDAKIGWRQSENSRDIFYDDVIGGLRLGDENTTAILPTEPGGTFGGITRPTGLAVGPDGRLFLADPGNNQLLSYTVFDEAFKLLWQSREHELPDPYTLNQPRGVAFSPERDLVVADTGNGRIVIYTWPQLVTRHIITLPGSEPWDVDYDSRGRLYVADAAEQRVHRFDRLWRLDTAYLGGAGDLIRPRHLAIDDGDQLFVVDDGTRSVVALDDKGGPISDDDSRLAALPLHRRIFPPALRLESSDLWLPQDERPDCPALPLPGLSVDRRGRLIGSELLLLARPQGIRYPRNGRYVSDALDSEIFNCRWHRLVLDATIPANTSLTVRTFTAPNALDESRIATLTDSRLSTPITVTSDDAPELLLQSEPGRYLWLRVDFNGNGEATPLIRNMLLYGPRQSALQFLPPVFHEDATSSDFLDRFLSYFDTVFSEIESQIEAFTGYLDPDGVPSGDFLIWLGSWLDLKFLAEWPDATRRDLIRETIALYKQRGTVPGMQKILRFHTGLTPPQPIIIEHFRLRNYTERRQTETADLVNNHLYLAGARLMPTADDIAHHFTIIVPSQAAPDETALVTLHQLIAAQKPAHTSFQLRVAAPELRIGCQSTVGVDTLIGRYPTAPLDEMILSQSSQLATELPRLGFTRLLL
jgi:phage tail-like protein